MKPSICWKLGWPLVPLVLLAGCGGASTENEAEDPANAAIAPGPMLGGVDLSTPLQIRPVEGRAWAVDLAPGRILFQQEGAKDVPFYPVSPRIAGGTASYPTQTPEGGAVTITLRPAACGDGATLAATVKIGANTLNGCAYKVTVEQVHRDMYNEVLAIPFDDGGNNSSSSD